jgi:hypothetical protein
MGEMENGMKTLVEKPEEDQGGDSRIITKWIILYTLASVFNVNLFTITP